MALSFNYVSGVVAYTVEAEVLQSSFLAAGIRLSVKASPFTFVLTQSYSCDAKTGADCAMPLLQWGSPSWTYVPVYYPSGGTLTADTGHQYQGGPALPFRRQLNRLIQATHHSSSTAALFAYENFLADQAAYLWLPNAAYQISVISKRLQGVGAQDTTGHIYPEDWSVTSG